MLTDPIEPEFEIREVQVPVEVIKEVEKEVPVEKEIIVEVPGPEREVQVFVPQEVIKEVEVIKEAEKPPRAEFQMITDPIPEEIVEVPEKKDFATVKRLAVEKGR